MKKIFLLSLVSLLTTTLFAQTICVPGTQISPKNAYILPDSATNMANACPGTYYEQLMYLKAAKDTVITITTPIQGVLTAKIDSFVVDANIVGLPTYLSVQSVPAPLTAAGAGSPKSNFTRLVLKGDSLACVKVSGNVPAGTSAATLPLTINLRVYTSNIHSADLILDALIPTFYPGRVTDTLTAITDYRILVFPTPCFATGVSDLAQYGFELVGSMPNPADESARIVFESNQAENLLFTVSNMMGEIMYSQTVKTTIGMNYIPVNVSSWAAGTYLYTLKNQKHQLTKKMMVQ